jgi:hypothetical protein
MNLFALALWMGMSVAPATASDTKAPALELRPKAAIAASAPHSYAPFVSPAQEHSLELVPRRDPRQDQSRSSCNSDRALCYDQESGRIVYKPARQLMPDIPGLQRENISVKRDRIVFRYSF